MDQIKEEHILSAIKEIDEQGIRAGRHSSTYDLIYDGKTYPPKLVISIANRYATGEELDSNTFAGGLGTDAFKLLEKLDFKIVAKKNNLQELITKYKKHIQKTQLQDEKYKWELLDQYKGRPNIEATDFLAEVKGIKYNNLIYPMALAVLHIIIKANTEAIRLYFKDLFNESLDLSSRVTAFSDATLKVYLGNGGQRQHHQDERSIATYLTFYNPEKYTFYKYSFYKKLCELLNEKEAKKNEKYPHYLLMLNRIIKDYIQDDVELISLVKSYVPEYDGSNHLLLAQDILYQMLDKQENVNEVNVKDAFVDWMVANVSGGNYFEKQFRSNRTLFEKEINNYEAIYKENFNSELFIINATDYKNDIKAINTNLYKPSTPFAAYNKNHASGRPTAMLGNRNYLRFLEEYFSNQESITSTTTINEVEKMKSPLNQILYGPPGTGKTYNTVLEAAKIITNNETISYDAALKVFKDNLDGQIEFITFHQNYSYEDFIQGLRPDTENGSALTFEKKDGVFKRIAVRANKNLKASENPASAKKEFDLVFQELIKPLSEGDVEEVEIKMKKSSFFITAVGEKSIDFRKNIGDSEHTLSINTLRKMYDKGINDIILGGLQPYYNPILVLLVEKGRSQVTAIERKNYVIIIDEINRANISRVFGELITLIEEDKRSHGKIPMRVTLPSGDSFIVPSNLFIIGTMNTADKSIALLDIALRRRFEFVPKYPVYEGLEQIVNDADKLKKINEAIVSRKNHDFTIGHAYFMGDDYNFEKTINHKVIPLLLEYFMNTEKEVIDILKEAGITIGGWPLKMIP